MLRSFHTWYRYRRLLALVTIVAAGRSDSDARDMEQAKRELERAGGRVVLLDYQPLELSSTDIRRIFRNGGDIRACVSAFVADYMNKRKLYL